MLFIFYSQIVQQTIKIYKNDFLQSRIPDKDHFCKTIKYRLP